MSTTDTETVDSDDKHEEYTAQELAEIAENARDAMQQLLDRAQGEHRGLKASEQRDFDRLVARAKKFGDWQRLAERDERLQAIVRSANGAHFREKYPHGVRGDGVPLGADGVAVRGPYRKGATSFFADIARARLGDMAATQRLAANENARHGDGGMERAVSTTIGSAGAFTPPAWLEDEFIALARPGRVVADLCHHEEMPAGVSSINLPRVASGTSVAIQGTQNTPVAMQDITTDAVSSPIVTIAGAMTVSQQVLDQSPVAFDELVMTDLAADYARQLNAQVLTGTGTGGQLTGLTTAAANGVTYTDASPTLGKLYSKIAAASAAVATSRYAGPDAIVMHPTRWAWCFAQLDTTNRPLITPVDAVNGVAATTAPTIAQGAVGKLAGLPVFLDNSIPTNLGTGTNQDQIVLARFSDSWLFESPIRAEVFPQTYASNLSVLVRLYSYVALAHRYPKAVAVIGGTGLVAPTF